MRIIKIMSAICLVALFSISGKKAYKSPPGTVRISEDLFFDIGEISNFNWKEYVSWNENNFGKESTQYKSSLPDTTVWSVSFPEFDGYTIHYYNHPLYNTYPVVGISYEQAKDYCTWEKR